MVFSDTSTKQGLIQDCEMIVFNEYGRISDNENLLYNFTNLINRQYDKAVSIIIENDSRWQYDDTSYTTTATVTANLVSAQSAYTLDASHLHISRVRVKDSASNWHILSPLDQSDETAQTYLSPQNPVLTGTPLYYEKHADQIRLYPTPNASVTSGLEIVVQRTPNYFAFDDTTQQAGLAPIFHRFLSMGASLDYAIVNNHANKNDIAQLYSDERDRMAKFYQRRNREEVMRLTVNKQDNK